MRLTSFRVLARYIYNAAEAYWIARDHTSFVLRLLQGEATLRQNNRTNGALPSGLDTVTRLSSLHQAGAA